MTQEVTVEDRRLARKINRRRRKHMRWNRIAAELGIDWRKEYNRLYARFPLLPDGTFDVDAVAKRRVAA